MRLVENKMGKLNIELQDEWSFKFTVEEGYDKIIINTTKQIFCGYCHRTPLDKTYLYIINQLKKAGYLYESYEPICCYCKVLTKFGLMDLRGNLSNFFYSEFDDILLIKFSYCHPMRKPHFNGESRWDHANVRIHDWSKIKEA